MRKKILAFLAALSCRRPWLVVGVTAAITSWALLATVLRGKFATDLLEIIPRDPVAAPKSYAFRELLDDVKTMDFSIIVIEADDPDDIQTAKGFVEALGAALEKKDWAAYVDYRFGGEVKDFVAKVLEDRGFLLLEPEDARAVASRLSREVMFKQMRLNRKRLEVDVNYFRRRVLPDPLDMLGIFQKRLERYGGAFDATDPDGFIVSPDGKAILISIRPTRSVQDVEFSVRMVKEIKQLEEEVAAKVAAEDESFREARDRLKILHTGGYDIALSETRVLTKNVIVTVVTSFLGVLILFALVYKQIGSLFYVGLPLALSVLWTLGVAFSIFGQVSIMSAGFGAILIGLGIDFGIHVYNRYITERSKGESVEESIKLAVCSTGGGIFYGALTTAIAFYAVVFTKFRGMTEFGFLTGTGVLLAMVAMLMTLPAMLVLRARRGEPPRHVRPSGLGLAHLSRIALSHPKVLFLTVSVIFLGVTTWVCLTTTLQFFDTDFGNLRAAHSPAFERSHYLMEKFETKAESFFVSASGASPEEALERAEGVADKALSLVEKGEILKCDTLVRFVPTRGRQEAAVEELRKIDFDRARRDFEEASNAAGLGKAFRKGAFKGFLSRLASIERGLASPRYITLEEALASPLGRLLCRYYVEHDGVHKVVTYLIPKQRGSATPESWFRKTENYLGADGEKIKFLVPVLVSYELRDLVWGDFGHILLFVSVGVILCLIASFGSPMRALMALFPLAYSFFFMIGTMKALHWLYGYLPPGLVEELPPIRFNYMNVLALPAIIGIGIDYGIHMLHRFIEHPDADAAVRETGRAVVMAGLTTMIGCGSLVFSSYRGLASLGLVMCIGVFFCVLNSVAVLPAFLNGFVQGKEGGRPLPLLRPLARRLHGQARRKGEGE